MAFANVFEGLPQAGWTTKFGCLFITMMSLSSKMILISMGWGSNTLFVGGGILIDIVSFCKTL